MVLQAALGIPLLAGAGGCSHRSRANGLEDDDAPVTTHGNKLDVALWPPSKPVEYIEVLHRQAHERPCEGVITSSEPNKNAI